MPAYAMAVNVNRSFKQVNGWCTSIRGVESGVRSKGCRSTPFRAMTAASNDLSHRNRHSDRREMEFGKLGVDAVDITVKNTDVAAFIGPNRSEADRVHGPGRDLERAASRPVCRTCSRAAVLRTT